MAERLGETFIRKKLVTAEQLEAALQEQSYTGEFLGQILVRLGFAQEEELLKVLAEQFNTKFVSLEKVPVNPTVIKLVPGSLVFEHGFLPIEMRSGVLLVAISNPLDVWPLSVLQEKLGLIEVRTVLAKKSDIQQAIKKYYGPNPL